MAAKSEMSAGIRFEILGFNKTVTNMASLHHGLFLVRQGADFASKAVLGLVQTFKLADAAGKFEEALVAVGQISQATTKELLLLRNAALEAGLKTQFSPQEAIEGLQTLAAMGFKAKESIALLQPVLDLAAGSLGQLGLAQAASAVAGTMRAFRLETGKAVEVTDKLLRITQLTNFQAKDFGSGLSKAAGEAGQFGQTIDDTLILMGLLRNMNLNASVSSTALRNSVRRLAGDARVRNLVESKGIQVYSKLTGKMRPVLDILHDLDKKTKSMSQSQKDLLSAKIFGARGIFAAGAFEGARFSKTLADGTIQTLKGMEAIKAYRKELEKSAGTAKRFRAAMLNTFEGQKKLMKGIVQTAGVLAGEPFVKVLKPLVALVVRFASSALKTFRSIPAPVKKFLAALTLALSVFISFGAIVITAKIALSGLFVVMAALNVTFLGIAATVIALSALFLGLVALGALLVGAFKSNFGGVSDAFERINKAVVGVWTVMKAWKNGTSSLSKEMAADLKSSGVLDFVIRLGGWLGRLRDWFVRMFEMGKKLAVPLGEALAPLGKSIKSLIQISFKAGQRIFEAIFGPFQQLKGVRKDLFGFGDVLIVTFKWIAKAATFIAKGINLITKAIKAVIQPGFFSAVFSKVAAVFKKIWAFLRPIVGMFVNIVIDLLPAAFTILTAIWDVFKVIGTAVGAVVLGLMGGVDMIAGGGGILPTIQAVASVFTVIVQVVALFIRGLAIVIGWISKILIPIMFVLSTIFGGVLGIIIHITKWLGGAIVSALNVVLAKVNSMMKPFKWLFSQIQKINPFAKKVQTLALKNEKQGVVGKSADLASKAILGFSLVQPDKVSAGKDQRARPPVLGGPDLAHQRLLLSSTLGVDGQNKEDRETANRALSKLAASDDAKMAVMQRQALAIELLVKKLGDADLSDMLSGAFANGLAKAKTDSYGTG